MLAVALTAVVVVMSSRQATPQTETWDMQDASNKKNALTKDAQPTNSVADGIVHYGENVYYFPYIRADFANALAKFLKNNNSLEVTAMTGDVVPPATFEVGQVTIARN